VRVGHETLVAALAHADRLRLPRRSPSLRR
jgi:hypothetical protein